MGKLKGKKKSNKEKNLRKKKKAKFKSRESKGDTIQKGHVMQTLCHEFKKLNYKASPQQIVRAKHRRDERMLKRDMKDLCKDLKSLCNKDEENKDSDDGEEEECFAAVENLAKKVDDYLIINENSNNEPGFRFTRWQQRKFHQNIRKHKYKVVHNDGHDNDDEVMKK